MNLTRHLMLKVWYDTNKVLRFKTQFQHNQNFTNNIKVWMLLLSGGDVVGLKVLKLRYIILSLKINFIHHGKCPSISVVKIPNCSEIILRTLTSVSLTVATVMPNQKSSYHDHITCICQRPSSQPSLDWKYFFKAQLVTPKTLSVFSRSTII